MLGPEAVDFLKPRLFALVLLAGACKYCFGSCTSLLAVLLALLFVFYITWEAVTIKGSSSAITSPVKHSPAPSPATDPPDDGLDLSRVVGQLADPADEITRVAQQLDEIQGSLERHGDWAEEIGAAFLKSLERIHKKQQEHLRQHNDLRNDYDEKLGSVVNVLDDLRHENAEAARAAAENNTSLCNTISQHRQDIENNHSAALEYMRSVNTTLVNHGQTIESVRAEVVQHTEAFQTKLDGHAQTVEDNKKLVREHGALINSAVSDHAQLIAEYQVALDGMVSLNKANRVFSLVHVPYGWETLGDVAAENLDDRLGVQSSAQPEASMLDSVQELSRAFRGTTGQTAHATTPSPTDEMMAATVLSQIQDTVQATLNEHTAEMGQLRKAQEDIKQLRADLGDIEEFRRAVRERQQLEKEYGNLEKWQQRQAEILDILNNHPERYHQDPELRAEVDRASRIVAERQRERAAADKTASSRCKTAKAAAV